MKTNENGRSMVEMLGVLAIIGVLSVGGIYGYTSAMKKYKANEIAQVLGMLATMAHSKNAGVGGTVYLGNSGLEKEPAGVKLDVTTTGTAGTRVVCTENSTAPCVAHLAFQTSQDTDGSLLKAVCGIVPKSETAGVAAGYYLTGCPS